MYVADPGSAGASGRFLRRRIVQDIEHVADDMITILKMSPSGKLKEHVGMQVARVVEYDGGRIAGGGGGGGGGGVAMSDAECGAGAAGSDVDAGIDGDEGCAGSDGRPHRNDLEDEIWDRFNK